MSLNIAPRVMRSIITDKIPNNPRKDTIYHVNNRIYTAGRRPQSFGRRVALVGDSRNSMQYQDGAQKILTARHFFNRANSKLGNRMKTVLNIAVSGARTDQYLTNIDAATQVIASQADYVLVLGCINNLAAQPTQVFPYTDTKGRTVTQTTVGSTSFDDVKEFSDIMISNGIRPILVTDPGSTSLSGPSQLQLQVYNLKLKQYAEANPEVIYFDLCPLVHKYNQASNIDFIANAMVDPTHYSNHGGELGGVGFAVLMDPIIPKFNYLPSINTQAGNVYTPLLNPLFVTQTGGAANTVTITSGALPANWAVKKSANTVAVVITYPNPKEIKFDITVTGGAANFYFEQEFQAISGITNGMVFEGGISYAVAGGASAGYSGVDVYIEANDGTTSDTHTTNYIGANGAMLSPDAGDLKTTEMTLAPAPAIFSWIKIRAEVIFNAAGTASVTFSNPWVEQRV